MVQPSVRTEQMASETLPSARCRGAAESEGDTLRLHRPSGCQVSDVEEMEDH